MLRAPPSRRRREVRLLRHLRALDIGQRQRAGRDLGAREGAKTLQRLDAVKILHPPHLRGGVAAVASHRRKRNPQVVQQSGETGVFKQSRRRDDLARLRAPDLGAEAHFVGLRQNDGAGGDVDARQPVDARLGARDRHQSLRAPRLQQPLLGDRAGRHQPHHVPFDHRLAAALARLGGVLDLLAHGDAMAQTNQLLQIIVRPLHRHAAHRDIVSQMLAAFGQHDAERLAGCLRVRKEHLVEIAHPVEQQAIRIDGLDLQILRHHRRRGGAGLNGFAHVPLSLSSAATLASKRRERTAGCAEGVD